MCNQQAFPFKSSLTFGLSFSHFMLTLNFTESKLMYQRFIDNERTCNINFCPLMSKVAWLDKQQPVVYMLKRGVPLCRKLWLKSRLKSVWNKHGFFNVTGFSVPIFVIEIVIEERAVHARSEKSDWNRQKSIIERTQLFLSNRFHCAENRQSPSRFFGKWMALKNIYVARVVCMT